MPGGGGETACPARKAPGFTAGQRERVRAFRFGHRFGTEAESVRRLLDLGMEAVARGLLPAHPEERDQPRSPGEGGASSRPSRRAARPDLRPVPGARRVGAGSRCPDPRRGRMAGRARREPRRRAGSATLVDLNIWDVLFGLMESAEAPAAPEADGRPAGDVPADAGTGGRDGPAGPVRAAGHKAGRESRRGTRREGEGKAGPRT